MIKEIQIFGTKKCKISKQAERFFKEKGFKVHFIDLNYKIINVRELNNFIQKFGIDEIDQQRKQ